ncbi:MAG: hypothetical protein IAE79_04415 [Anaerolinea sp.]|nr:hypothetical protein [Anaerolinea sp.]
MKKKWEEWKKFYRGNQGLGLMGCALLYTILLILAFIVLVGSLKIPEASVTGAGQLFADCLLFPTVIIGFYIAIKEFRQSQITPKLEISLYTQDVIVDNDVFILRPSNTNITSYRVLFQVNNTGELIIPWYRVTIDLSEDLFRFSEAFEEETNGNKTGIYVLRWQMGNQDNVGDHLIISENPKKRQYEFKSNGQHALFPGQSVHLATLEVTIPAGYIQTSRQGQIMYSVVTDKTKMEYKSQTVVIAHLSILPSYFQNL